MTILILKASREDIHTSGDRMVLPVKNLYSTIGKRTEEDFRAISDSVSGEGMLNPIVVWQTTVGEWLEWANTNPDIEKPPPSLLKNPSKRVFLVKCGNNRLIHAITNGYRHIDCIVSEDRAETSRLCTELRKSWNENSTSKKSEAGHYDACPSSRHAQAD